MPEDYLTEGQDRPLPGVVHRCIGRLLINVESFEVNPHWMSVIRNSPVRDCVSQQQMTELIVDSRLGNRQDR